MKNVGRRTDNDWRASDGSQTVHEGNYYVILEEEREKYKLLGYEEHWLLKSRFSLLSKKEVEYLTELSDEKLLDKCNAYGGRKGAQSLFECIKYIQTSQKATLLAWANEDLVTNK